MGFDKAKAIRAAEKYLAQGKIPSAIQEYARIVEFDAEDFNALNTLGDLYARVEKKDAALACYRRVAEHYREQGFTLKAIAMFKKLTRFGADDHATALSLAALYEQQGLLADARAQYLVAADAFTRAGQSREALEVLQRIADLDPTNTKIRLRLADSYAKENAPELAAEAYTQAGERLAARGEFEQALDAFTKSLALRPGSHAALHGLLAAHTALGTADEAAEVLKQTVEERPGDSEARALLCRAYVEAEDAERAERATQELVSRDSSNFTLYFDVIRLHLRQGNTDEAARLIGWVLEPSLAGRQDAPITELLQEVLARNPEQLDAHRMLVRAYTALHDDARLRSALERLAEAAEATGATEDERAALAQLVRLAPYESAYQSRLEALGGPPSGESAGGAGDVPTFESFMLSEDAARTAHKPADAQQAPPPEFEWNSVAMPEASDASASFAELNDLTDGAAGEFDLTHGQPAAQGGREQPPQAGFQEFDFGAHAPDAGGAQAGGASVERMLRQELESVDFYIEQGYSDIAGDTLDMLENQYGPHADIDARRARLASAASAAQQHAAAAPAPEFVEEVAAQDEFSAEFSADFFTETPAETQAAAPPQPSQDAGQAQAPQQQQPARAGIDPGLAAIFDEFREAVEDTASDDGADFDTHYQMGLAYREMGLHDQAVEEFQTAAGLASPGDGTPRFLQCCNMLGHCFMEKGMPRPAATWFKKGLAAPGHTEDEYQAMRFDLGTAYEQMGDTERAIEVLSEVYAIDVSYRGVADRLRELQKASK